MRLLSLTSEVSGDADFAAKDLSPGEKEPRHASVLACSPMLRGCLLPAA